MQRMQEIKRVDVSIIIVNYNSYKLVETCIDSIFEFTKEISYEIILVDNASTDQSALLLQRRYPGIKVVINERNLGFGMANNVGVENAKGEYFLFLNPDTYLLNNAIEKMYYYLKTNKDCLVVGCWLRDVKGNIVGSGGRFPQPYDFFVPVLNRILGKRKNKYRVNSRDIMEEFENVKNATTIVDWIIGADLMLHRSHFIEIGGFDGDFFMYWEEVYLQYALKQKFPEKTNILLNAGKVVHIGGGTTEKTPNARRIAVEDRSVLTYIRKTRKIVKYRVFAVIYLVLRCVSLITRSDNHVLKQYFWHFNDDSR